MNRKKPIKKMFSNKSKFNIRFYYVALILAPAFAMTVSLAIGLKQSVWFDEAYSIFVAKQPLAELIRLTALDTHPPLYYIALKTWATIFGWGEVALRSFSVICLGGAIVIAGLLIKKMFGYKVAAGVLLLMAISPLLLRYGFEIRMYALGSLIGVLATYILHASVISKELSYLKLALYAAFVAIGTYTLYYLVLLWFAHISWLLYVYIKQRNKPKELLQYVYAYLGAATLFLPWLPSFISQTTNGALASIGKRLNLEELIGILTFNIAYEPLYRVEMLLTLAVIACLSVTSVCLYTARHELLKYKENVALLGMYIGVPIAALMLVSFFRPMYVERYLAHVAIGLIMFVGVIVMLALGNMSTRAKVVVVSFLFIPFMVGLSQLSALGNFNFQRLETPQVNAAAKSIPACDDRKKIVAADPYVAIELSYYVPSCAIYFLSEWDTLGGGYAPLSGSEYQIKSESDLPSDMPFTFVHYGDMGETIASNFTETNRREFGILRVSELSRDSRESN